MPRIPKTIAVQVIQCYCPGAGYGWEDCAEYDANDKHTRQDLKEYRASGDGLQYRLIRRRVRNPAFASTLAASSR